VATSERYIHNGVGVAASVFDVPVSGATGDSFYSCYPNEPLPFDLVPNHPMSRHGHFSFDDTMVEQSCLIIETGIKNNLTKVKSSAEEDDDEKENNFRVIKGDFITVSTITATLEHAQHLFKAFNHPCMESMEGAASAHIAALYNIPFIEVRAASNAVGVRNKSQWNIPLACQRASFAVKSLLENGI
jgi:futalosine hydrolase